MIGIVISGAVFVLIIRSLLSLRKMKSFLFSDEGDKSLYTLVFPLSVLFFIPVIASNVPVFFPEPAKANIYLLIVLVTNLFYVPGMVVAFLGSRQFDQNLDDHQRAHRAFNQILFAGTAGIIATLALPLIILLAGVGITVLSISP